MMAVLGVVFERHRGASGCCLRGSSLRRSSPGRQPQPIRATTSRTVENCLIGDCFGQLGSDGGALAAGEVAAPQFCPQLVDMVVKLDHRWLRR
jgi:hypothetical protein